MVALEGAVVSLRDDLVALAATVTEYNEDVQAKLAALQAQIDAVGNPAELQAAFNELSTAVTAGVTAVGDADADGNPPPVTPTP